MRSSNYKKLLLAAVMAVGFITITPCLASAQATPEATLTAFYKWYIHELVSERVPSRVSAKVNAVASARLQRWFRTREGKSWDADYFIDAQDFDPKWETHIDVSKPVINGNNADVRVILGPRVKAVDSMSPHTLRIKMVKERGGWKIDHINGY